MLQDLWKCSDETQLKAVTLMWEWVRNKAIAGEATPSSEAVCHRVEKLLVEQQSLKKPNKPPKPPDIHKLCKPPDDHVKVNFDGAFDSDSGSGGWGYVICDQAGDFIAAGAGKSTHLIDALHSEAVACLAAIVGANRVGVNIIIF